MPFHIGSGCLPATISNRRIYRIAWSDTPPEMSSWEKMKEFFAQRTRLKRWSASGRFVTRRPERRGRM